MIWYCRAEIASFLGYEREESEQHLAVVVSKVQTSTKTMKKIVPKKKTNLGQYFFDKDMFSIILRDGSFMNRVRHIYLKLKDLGVTWESARELMKAKELERPRTTAVGITRELLLEYLALVTPEDRMYPFYRPKPPPTPTFFGIPNALAIQIFTMKQKFKMR